MKKTDRDFEVFKAEFTRRQRQFGLTGYQIFFQSCAIDGCYADIIAQEQGMVATVRYNNALPAEYQLASRPKPSAKHEALHLLIHRLQHLAEKRYVTESEVDEAGEELVRKLESLIP